MGIGSTTLSKFVDPLSDHHRDLVKLGNTLVDTFLCIASENDDLFKYVIMKMVWCAPFFNSLVINTIDNKFPKYKNYLLKIMTLV